MEFHEPTRKFRMMIKHALMVMFAWIAWLPDEAPAAYTFYNTQSTFLAGASAAGVPVTSTETFDEFSSGTVFPSPVSLSGITYTTFGAPTPPSAYQANGGGFWPSESGSNVFVLATGFVPAILAFSGGHVAAFGLALSAPVTTTQSNPLLYSVSLWEADGSRHDMLIGFTNPGIQYLGFVESAGSPGIAEIGLIVTPGTSAVAFDDVSRSAVVLGSFALINPVAIPGPASLIMLGSGLAGVGAAYRLRRG